MPMLKTRCKGCALEQAVFGEGIGLVADDHMIENPHLHQIQGILNPLGDVLVRRAGTGVAGRVVMTEDAGGGVVFHRRLDEFTGIDAGVVDSAPEQLLEGQHPMLVVQPKDGEHFML